jgi:hypothetical protein
MKHKPLYEFHYYEKYNTLTPEKKMTKCESEPPLHRIKFFK